MCSEAAAGSEPARWPVVLPFAAALWSLLARAVPLELSYHPNALGIVSLATLQRYPAQQETVWLALTLAAGSVLALGLEAAFRAAERRGAARAPHAFAPAGRELLAAGAVAAVLLLPPGPALFAVTIALAGALGLATRSGVAPDGAAREEVGAPPRAQARLGARLATAAGFVALSVLLTPPFLDASRHLAAGTPDARLVSDGWSFHAELGQHLVWADAMRRGELPGRDFFTLYGPLYPASLLATWSVVGRSVAASLLWDALLNVAGWLLVLAAGVACLRQRALVLGIPFLVSFSTLRVALPLLALLALLRGSDARRPRGPAIPALLAGVAVGASLLFSPEFGVAALVATLACLLAAGAFRAALASALGVGAVLVPVLGGFAAAGALAPFVRDLVGYSSWMLAGFGKLPFPSPVSGLPLDLASADTPHALVLRLGLGAGAVFAAAAWSALPAGALALGRLRALPAALAARLAGSRTAFAALWLGLYGLVGFRSVLGRSDLTHAAGVLPVSALLLVLAADHTLAAARASAARRPVALVRLAALAAFAVAAGFTTIAAPLRVAGISLASLRRPAGAVTQSEADARVWQVAERIRALTPADGAIYVLPNSAAYPFLAERRIPTRFALAHQMVTNAHRAEALRALEAHPPALVVWDDAGVRVDGIPDDKVLGAPILAWLSQRYELAERIGPVRLLRPREAP